MSHPTPHRFGIATIYVDGQLRPAVVTDEGVIALAALLEDGPTSVRGLLADWDTWCDRIAAVLAGDATRGWVAAESVTFAPPLPDPPNLYLAGANYYDHIKEMKAPVPDKSTEDVFHFMVPSASLTGNRHDVIRPAGVTELDWEVELALVIGRRAERVTAERALDYVAGYTVANDVSIRSKAMFHPIFGVRFLYAKGQATLTPMGPAIVPARFISDPAMLDLSLLVNGEVRQKSTTEQMIWSAQEQIAFLSSQAPLLPGDVILTGTPAGTAAAHGAYLADGDVMTASIDGVGTLVNQVVGTPV